MAWPAEIDRRASVHSYYFDDLPDVVGKGGVDHEGQITDLAVEFLHGVFSGLA
jgi:hypothetical protein